MMTDVEAEFRGKVLGAARALLSVCDGAHDLDGAGYNGYDAGRVREILRTSDDSVLAGKVRYLYLV
ncbi:MAG: hypothetical protein ACREB3_00675, partial [Burkholderiales bacterium]